MSLNDINSKIEERVKQNSQKIIVGMYQNMIKSHNDFCGCNYCNILKDYIEEKKKLSRYNRWVDEQENVFSYDLQQNSILRMKFKIEEMKLAKNKLKIL